VLFRSDLKNKGMQYAHNAASTAHSVARLVINDPKTMTLAQNLIDAIDDLINIIDASGDELQEKVENVKKTMKDLNFDGVIKTGRKYLMRCH